MQRIEPIIALIAFIVAIFVAFGVYHIIYTAPQQTSNEPCPPLPEMKEVMIASSIISTGDPIANAVVYEKWPHTSLKTEFYFKNELSPEQLKSLVARRIINQGEPITKSSIVDRKDRSVLSALLNKGMRAVSLNLDTNSGMVALLNPGDIVDVIIALNATGKEKEGEETTHTAVCGVRVLAIDQHLSSSTELAGKKTAEGGQPPKSVTLEVTPHQASVLASANKSGTLSLSLHSTDDTQNTCTESTLKPLDQVKIIRGDAPATPQKS